MNQLTLNEKRTFAECERIIERGKQTFVAVGAALQKIRDQKLYREQYATFEDYCRERWGWSRQRAYQIISAAEVVKSLPAEMSTMVDTERAARAVASIPKGKRVEVVRAAAQTGRVTAKTVEKAGAQMGKPCADLRDRTEARRVVPREIRPLWERAESVAARLIETLQSVKNEIARGVARRDEDAIWAECSNADVSSLEQVIFVLKQSVRPFAVCPTCHGTKTRSQCQLCRGRGFIGKHLWESCVPVETKKLLIKNHDA